MQYQSVNLQMTNEKMIGRLKVKLKFTSIQIPSCKLILNVIEIQDKAKC